MSALPVSDKPTTEAEYLAFERDSEIKHEFIDGEIYAMSGASRHHNLITASVIATLYNQLRGKDCETYPSDMKVRTPSTGAYVYPDIIVVCGEARFADDQHDVLLNPTVIIEVLSATTEAFDRGVKFQRYRELVSLQEYILIAQDRPHIERFVRQENGLWQFSEAYGLQASITLTSIACQLALADVYEPISFDSDEAGHSDEQPAG
jgi:Uma2 family endonuclease